MINYCMLVNEKVAYFPGKNHENDNRNARWHILVKRYPVVLLIIFSRNAKQKLKCSRINTKIYLLYIILLKKKSCYHAIFL
jgi:hypothetical protein